jgi:hypothetical protein
MGTVFKPFVTRPLPEGAEIVTRAGKPVAMWVDGGGKKRQAPATVGASRNAMAVRTTLIV